MREITLELALSAGQDAANKRMRKAGRTKWSRADYNLACAVREELYPSPVLLGKNPVKGRVGNRSRDFTHA